MKRLIYLLALLASFSIVACEQQTTVDDVINKMVAAQGGAEALAAIEDQVSTWESSMVVPMGDSMVTMTGETTIRFKRPNKIMFETAGPDGNVMMTSAFDGTNGWVTMTGQTRDMVESEVQEHMTMGVTWIDGWQNYAEKDLKLELLPDSTIDGATYHVIQVTDKYGNVSLNFCNTETSMIERTSQETTDPATMQKVQNTMVFSDYAMHGGFMMPGTIKNIDADGNMMLEAKIKELKNNAGVSDDAFAKPAEMEMESESE